MRDQDVSRALADELRAARAASGVPMARAASEIGIHPTVMSRIETGRVGVSVPRLLKLCGLYAVSPAAILRRVLRAA